MIGSKARDGDGCGGTLKSVLWESCNPKRFKLMALRQRVLDSYTHGAQNREEQWINFV
uniref:Uncharacterized protein n=1 Tax=Arundo donax TaxID=35708 RepID=A0A0A8ZDX7_ARUDO